MTRLISHSQLFNKGDISSCSIPSSSSAFSSRSNSIASMASSAPWNNSLSIDSNDSAQEELTKNSGPFYEQWREDEMVCIAQSQSEQIKQLIPVQDESKNPEFFQHPPLKRPYVEDDFENSEVKYLRSNWKASNLESSETEELLQSQKKRLHKPAQHSSQHIDNHLQSFGIVHQTTSSESSINTSGTTLQCQLNNCCFKTYDSQSLASHEYVHKHDGAALNENGLNLFKCEWKGCSFQCSELDKFMHHVRQDHVISTFNQKESVVDVKLEDANEITPLIAGNVLNIKTESPAPRDSDNHICLWKPEKSSKICGATFASSLVLNSHVIDVHVGVKKSSYSCRWSGCERSGKPFTQRQKIHRHLITHTKNKPFVCSECGSAFSEITVLKQHQRVHSGERPFECKVCQKRFAASTALSVHMRTHTGEKPLPCKWPGCEKRFSESSNLTKHMKSEYIKIF